MPKPPTRGGPPGPPALGETLAAVVLADARGKRFSLPHPQGQPVVLLRSSTFRPEREPASSVDELRAELRGIGAVLLVLGPSGTYLLAADDRGEDLTLESGGEALPGPDPEGAMVLLVLDGQGRVRFSHRASGGDDARTVRAALAQAAAALARPPARRSLVGRRELVVSSLVAAFTLALLDDCTPSGGGLPPPAKGPAPAARGPLVAFKLDVNGVERELSVEPRVTLLDALRERLGLTGTKKGCDQGQCGACTVLVDDRRVNSCLTLAVMQQGKRIVTIEGLASGENLHPMQAAFLAHDGFQCGFCTPGQILSAVAMLREGHAKTEADIREQMSGNLCRCGAYAGIVAAIRKAQEAGLAMRMFTYQQPLDPRAAVSARGDRSAFVAGGTSLLDLMKLDVERPDELVDVNRLPFAAVEALPEGLRIGALVRNSDLAHDPVVRSRYPVLAEALLSGASPQLRNMATVGGNLLQRTRCPYFRDTATRCNKRSPGAGCDAIGGHTRMLAVLGVSPSCIASHPSDMCVALVALDAVVELLGPGGPRSVPLTDFYLLPGDHPERENVLRPGELITAVTLPPLPFAARSRYVKVRDRASFAFALTSAAAALDLQGGVIKAARLAMGGVGTRPWRAAEAERSLVGKPPGAPAFREAAELAMQGAAPSGENAFKIELGKRTVVRALTLCGAMP